MVQINDKYYALSSNEEIAENGECGGAVTSLLKFLLEEGIVDAVLAVKKGADLYDAVPTLITDPERNHRNSRIPTLRNTEHGQSC